MVEVCFELEMILESISGAERFKVSDGWIGMAVPFEALNLRRPVTKK